MARPPKLNENLLPAIRKAVRLGLSNAMAAAAVGVSRSSWQAWKAKALAAEPLLDGGWQKLDVPELRRMAADLELNLDHVPGTGKGGRLLKADIGAAVEAKARRFLDFLDELRNAEPYAKASLLELLDLITRGGNLGPVDPETGRRRGVRTKKTITYRKRMEVEVPAADGKPARKVVAMVDIAQEERVEERELPPNRLAIQRMLEIRWPEEFGRRKAINAGDVEGPQSKAAKVAEAVIAMFSTVPEPPALPVGDPEAEDK